jgi:hypothetical protein
MKCLNKQQQQQQEAVLQQPEIIILRPRLSYSTSCAEHFERGDGSYPNYECTLRLLYAMIMMPTKPEQ